MGARVPNGGLRREPACTGARAGRRARSGRRAPVAVATVLLLCACSDRSGTAEGLGDRSTPQPLSASPARPAEPTGDPGRSPNATRTTDAREAPGAPVGPGPQQGRPSPVRVPLPLDELQGRVFASGLADLRIGIARACGGNQCVSVVRSADSGPDGDERPCDTIVKVAGALRTADGQPFVDTVRGSRITVLVNLDCSEVPGSPGVGSPGPPSASSASRPAGTPSGTGTPSASR